MVKPQELRLGNYMKWVDADVYLEVLGILQDDLEDKYNLEYRELESGLENVTWEEHFEPIPLDRAWFQNFGFNESNGFWIDLTTHYLEMIGTIEDDGSRYYYPVYAEIGELSSEPEQRVSLNRIRYVHQLQNLHFALTGQELTIKKSISSL